MWHWSRLWPEAKRGKKKDHVRRKASQFSHSWIVGLSLFSISSLFLSFITFHLRSSSVTEHSSIVPPTHSIFLSGGLIILGQMVNWGEPGAIWNCHICYKAGVKCRIWCSLLFSQVYNELSQLWILFRPVDSDNFRWPQNGYLITWMELCKRDD